MLNFGWAEMMVIGVVALIVIGPDDLPDMFRQLGRFTGKLRTMSREFSRAMEQAAKDTGVKDVAKDLKAATSTKALGLDAVKSAADKFEKWDPIKNAAKPTFAPALGAKPLVPAPMPEMPKPAEAQPAEVKLAEVTPAVATATPETAVVGPATQALYDKQALKAQVLSEQSAKLRAIENGTYQPELTILPPAKTAPVKTAPVKAAKAAATPNPSAKPAADHKPAAESAASPKPRKTRTVNKADQS